MCVLAVKSEGVRCARSCMLGLSTIATLIVPPPLDRLSLWPPPQPDMTPPPIAIRIAIKATCTVRSMAVLLRGAEGIGREAIFARSAPRRKALGDRLIGKVYWGG